MCKFVTSIAMMTVVLAFAWESVEGGYISIAGRSSDWTTFQGNVLRTGWNDHDNIDLVIGKHWTVQVSEHCLDQLTVVGYRIYAVDRTDAGGPL
ncbi:hypothetical protein KQH82_10535 [bacterium]|nr:hypothetical protein [bacterium]